MKDKILDLIAGGEFELAKALIESQRIEFDVKEELINAAKKNFYIVNVSRYVDDVFVRYIRYQREPFTRKTTLLRGAWKGSDFFGNCYGALQFALTWKGGRQ